MPSCKSTSMNGGVLNLTLPKKAKRHTRRAIELDHVGTVGMAMSHLAPPDCDDIPIAFPGTSSGCRTSSAGVKVGSTDAWLVSVVERICLRPPARIRPLPAMHGGPDRI